MANKIEYDTEFFKRMQKLAGIGKKAAQAYAPADSKVDYNKLMDKWKTPQGDPLVKFMETMYPAPGSPIYRLNVLDEKINRLRVFADVGDHE